MIGAEAQLETAAPARRTRRGRTSRWAAWRVAVASLIGNLYAAEETRTHLERRYLDGHPALFPGAIADWERLRDSAERLAGLSDALRPQIDGTPRLRGATTDLDLDALRARARALAATVVARIADEARAATVVARIADEARAATLDILGDTEGATSIAARRLRANTEAQA